MDAAPKVTAYVIGYNDEPNIRACLETLDWADEIIFADSFSTDATAKIAAEYADKVVQIKFAGFGKLRNDAIAHASHDWIFSLDTDERATPEIANEIRALLARGPAAVAYFVPRKNMFLGRWIRHCGWYPDYRQPQLFDRRRFRYRDEVVHESFDADGPVGHLREHVIQIPFRDVKQMLNKVDRYTGLMAQRMIDQGRRFHAYQLVTHPCFAFVRMYLLQGGILDGLHGFVLSVLHGYYTFIKYVRFWEQQRR
jgi:glycosyltransferase involved in cell wall biosynthesis